MGIIEFEKKEVTARIRNPLNNFELTEEKVEIRFDPLTDRTARIVTPKNMDPVSDGSHLAHFVKESSPCFFCEGKVENSTPMLPEDVLEEGRIQQGDAFLFPNLSGYGQYSGVCIFSKKHFIFPSEFTPELIFNALKACQKYIDAVCDYEMDVLYPSISWNYLLPAGSSMLHPHIQPLIDSVPTSGHAEILSANMAFFEEHDMPFWDHFMIAERGGQRFIYEDDYSFWYTPFCPTGFNEINALIGRGEAFHDLEDEQLLSCAEGLKRVLDFYAFEGRNSLNMVIFSPPVPTRTFEAPCLLKMVTRPAFEPMYRNDITFLERLHNETVIDRTPEDVAEAMRKFIK